MTNIILASASPRRKQILSDAGIKFETIPSLYDENLEDLNFSQEKIENLAKNKGLEVVLKYPESIVISADTVVVYNNKIFTKPHDFEHAKKMLKELSNQTHFVQTSVCIIYKDKNFIHSDKTFVTFNNLSDKMIDNYINIYKPIDKAGAYGIQELPKGFVKSISGNIETVIGISSETVLSMLQHVNKYNK